MKASPHWQALRASAVCVLASLFATAAAAQPANGTPVSFLACPVAREVGPTFDVCFFAEHDGVRYGLANPPDWGVPQLKHRVLVEGRVKDGPLVCGGVAIEGRASVMADIDESCNRIAPNDGSVKGVAGGVFNSGTPTQKAYAQDLQRRAETDQKLTVVPAILDPDGPPAPAPPFTTQRLLITYPFDSDRGPSVEMVALLRLAEYARISKARSISIVGYRANSRLANGQELKEAESLAQKRAEKIAAILTGVGISPKIITVRWEAQPIAGKGDEDWRNRKVEVVLQP